MAVYTEKKYLTDNKLDIKKINPFVLTMPDNNYWKVGEKSGNAWNDGKNFEAMINCNDFYSGKFKVEM